MKILQLNLENITSLAGQHRIDFEQEPLCSAGLIAITGMTGSGKSSLLDAMCLALFNKVPRLREASGKLADISGDPVEIDSPSNLLRRGTAFGFAEVIFLAQDNKRYSARWSVKRARDKATGKLQAIQRELRCMEDNQIIATKATEVGQHIDRLLGLDFKQFTKTVLLAQSEVTAFIKANDNERAALLEYLTDSDIYSKIGALAFDKSKQAAIQVTSIERKIGEQQPLSEEARLALQQQADHLYATQNTQENQLKQLELSLQWYKQLDVLQQSTQRAQQQETAAQQQWNDFGLQNQLLKQLEQFEPIRTRFEQLAQASRQSTSRQLQLGQQQQTLDELQQHTVQVEQQLQNAKQQYDKQQHQQQQHAPAIKQSLKIELSLQHMQQQLQEQQDKQRLNDTDLNAVQEKLQQLLQQQKQLGELQQQHEQQLLQTQDLAIFDQEQRTASQFARMAQQRHDLLALEYNDPKSNGLKSSIFKFTIDAYKQQIEQQQQQLAHLVEQHQSTQQLEQQKLELELQLRKQARFISLCDNIADKIKLWHHIEQEQQNSQQRLASILQQQAEHLKLLEATRQAVTEARVKTETSENLWRQQQLLSQHSVEQLRAQLQPEQPCMVCGSTQHPYAVHEQLAEVLSQAVQQHYQQAKQQLEQCQQQWQQADKQQESLLQQQQHVAQQQESLTQRRLELLREIEHSSSNFYQQIQDQLNPAHAQHILQQKQQEFERESKYLEQQVQQLNQQLSNWHVHQQQLATLQQQLDKRLQLDLLERDYIQPLAATLQQQWQQDYQGTAFRIQQQLKQRLAARQALEQVQPQQLLLEKQLHAQQTHMNQLQQQSAQLTQIRQHLQKQLQGETLQLTQLFRQYGTPADTANSQQWQQWLDQQHLHCQQQLEQATAQQQRHQQAQLKLQADIQALTSQLHELTQVIQQYEQNISDWRHHYPQLDEAIIQQLLQLGYADKHRLQEQQRQLENMLEQARATLAVVTSQQAVHQQAQPESTREQLHEQQQQAQQVLQQLKEQASQLGLQLELDNHIRQQAQRHAVELEKARAEHYRWDKIASLIGSADGTKFKRIAQHYHLQILVTLANRQLVRLTPRYEIRHVENSLNLSIIDHFMNDEIRAVASLSGGESFLISLALALGIASMASGHTRLESLFIDEGFGTLDQNSLHMVMDALDRLQSQGRKVIVISHISEMHERIPVKIQVTPQGAGASKVEVTG